ncbi:bifunctional DNA primase/polymerase [Streptomyces fildesensis]|uniref:Bifunctional DNA primase/polymerase n=1 Tax=Streptomyces fildesensis TaxID=375757 RepID=A0ABW8CGP0_9ACTN
MPHPERAALLRAALETAIHGWPVFPLRPGDKRPAIKEWESRATTDPARIERCWTHAPYNVGIATGPARLVVVDLDTPKDNNDGPREPWNLPGITDGADVLATLCERHGQPYPTDTYTVRTGSGGTHLYFAASAATGLRNSAGTLGWKVDTRAGGGYVVGPGSTVNGRSYVVACDSGAAPLPEWLTELLRPAALPPQGPVVVALAANRHGAWLNAAVQGEMDRVADSPSDEHNNALYLASIALGQLVAGGELTEAEVTGRLLSAALRVGQGEREALRTIASGLRTGAKRPRKVAA